MDEQLKFEHPVLRVLHTGEALKGLVSPASVYKVAQQCRAADDALDISTATSTPQISTTFASRNPGKAVQKARGRKKGQSLSDTQRKDFKEAKAKRKMRSEDLFADIEAFCAYRGKLMVELASKQDRDVDYIKSLLLKESAFKSTRAFSLRNAVMHHLRLQGALASPFGDQSAIRRYTSPDQIPLSAARIISSFFLASPSALRHPHHFAGIQPTIPPNELDLIGFTRTPSHPPLTTFSTLFALRSPLHARRLVNVAELFGGSSASQAGRTGNCRPWQNWQNQMRKSSKLVHFSALPS
ncbi:hypothetical protein DFH09DRAFT_1094573 [Mycena vulgaris]|nr:hypothetical protein DFH09DRAFT_1094573 [Mycena vulgaris]